MEPTVHLCVHVFVYTIYIYIYLYIFIYCIIHSNQRQNLSRSFHKLPSLPELETFVYLDLYFEKYKVAFPTGRTREASQDLKTHPATDEHFDRRGSGVQEEEKYSKQGKKTKSCNNSQQTYDQHV